jgi:PPOX class probable F420-dependent enzyme
LVTLALTDETRDFLDEVMPTSVGTVRSNGTVQMNPVWYEQRDDEIWLNATSKRAWARRLSTGSPVTLLFIDPQNQFRWAQIQGTVIEKRRDGAEAHIDRLSRRYLGHDYTDHRPDEPRILIRVAPTRINGSVQQKAA